MIGTPPEGFTYVPDFLSEEAQSELLSQIVSLNYEHDSFRGQTLKRGYAQFGHAYVSTGRQLVPVEPLPEFLINLSERAKLYCPENSEFNQCIITHYPKNAGIGWHVDAPRFGDCIMAISLVGEGKLQFRPNGTDDASCEVLVAPGSLYVMTGVARWEYQHQVIKGKAERYSLTFRQVAES